MSRDVYAIHARRIVLSDCGVFVFVSKIIRSIYRQYMTPSVQSPKSKLILSPLCVRRMLSEMVGLTSIVTNFEQLSRCDVCGIVFVT